MLVRAYLGAVLDKDAATVALVAKLSLAVEGTILEPIWAYQRIDVFATLDGAIGPNISKDSDFLGHLSTLFGSLRQAVGFAKAHEVLASIDYAAVVVWMASSHSSGCSKQGCKSECSFHSLSECVVIVYYCSRNASLYRVRN